MKYFAKKTTAEAKNIANRYGASVTEHMWRILKIPFMPNISNNKLITK